VTTVAVVGSVALTVLVMFSVVFIDVGRADRPTSPNPIRSMAVCVALAPDGLVQWWIEQHPYIAGSAAGTPQPVLQHSNGKLRPRVHTSDSMSTRRASSRVSKFAAARRPDSWP
jgi:hypothetical protein